MLSKWKINDTEYNTTIYVDSKDVQKLLFHTPLDHSFTCKKWGSTQLHTSSKTLPNPGQPVDLTNSTVHTSMLKFDAFRVTGPKPPTGFRVSQK